MVSHMTQMIVCLLCDLVQLWSPKAFRAELEDMNVDDMAALAFLLLHHSNILAITVSWILMI